eukprot:1149325-Pelagomonas_calceolata.AAC.6
MYACDVKSTGLKFGAYASCKHSAIAFFEMEKPGSSVLFVFHCATLGDSRPGCCIFQLHLAVTNKSRSFFCFILGLFQALMIRNCHEYKKQEVYAFRRSPEAASHSVAMLSRQPLSLLYPLCFKGKGT